METERTLNVENIKEEGLVICKQGHLTLILKSDSNYYIIDENGSHLDCLSQIDIASLDQLIGIFNEWTSSHRLTTKIK